MRSFDLFGGDLPDSPVVLSVPHAGRRYSSALLAALRVPIEALASLEDRLVDAVALAARREETLLVQRSPRAWIDLNRSELERDPALENGGGAAVGVSSAKVRAGLGLVPRRTQSWGSFWRERIAGTEIDARIAADHRPYHAALAAALSCARARFGKAVLLDVHSMPTLGGTSPPEIVLGDRFGRAAGTRFVDRVAAEVSAAGLRQAINAPYAGGYILERHGDPAGHIHAVQIEFDRALYIDPGTQELGKGLSAAALLLRRIIDALADEALATVIPIAAE